MSLDHEGNCACYKMHRVLAVLFNYAIFAGPSYVWHVLYTCCWIEQALESSLQPLYMCCKERKGEVTISA